MISIKLKGTEQIKKLDIPLFFSEQLKSISKTIEEDITDNITNERVVTKDISGNYARPKPLDPKYLQWKVKKGYPKSIFQMKGNLIKSIKSKKISNNSYRIFISGKANEYSEYVNEIRKFFGISKTIIEQIVREFKSKKVA